MYSAEQHAAQTLKNTEDIARLWESAKSAHHRLSENMAMGESINRLANSVTEMATEVKHLAKRIDSSIEKIEIGQRAQGERIGNIERVVLSISRSEKIIDEHDKRLDAIERAPAHKWDKFTWLIVAGVAAAVVAFIMPKIL